MSSYLAIIAEPIESAEAGQFKFISALGHSLLPRFDVTIASTFVPPAAKEAFQKASLKVLSPESDRFILNRVLRHFGIRNEATRWVEAWLREAVLRTNSRLLRSLLSASSFDYVVNASNTGVYACNVWWTQGPPLNVTLDSIERQEDPAFLLVRAAKPVIRLLDRHLTSRLHAAAGAIVANSNYVRELYEQSGFPIDAVVFSFPDYSSFRPTTGNALQPYVLAYVGKETGARYIDTARGCRNSSSRLRQ